MEYDTTRTEFRPTEAEKELVKKKFGDDLKIPENFVQTMTAFHPTFDSNKIHNNK